MGQYGFRQLFANGIQGVQAGQGILKNHADFFAAQASYFMVRQLIDTLTA